MYTGMILIDLQKAFDTINHEILLDKLADFLSTWQFSETSKICKENKFHHFYSDLGVANLAVLVCFH